MAFEAPDSARISEALSVDERAIRLEQLAERAKRLRNELGGVRLSEPSSASALPGPSIEIPTATAVTEAVDRVRQTSHNVVAEAQLELIMSGDPLLAGTDAVVAEDDTFEQKAQQEPPTSPAVIRSVQEENTFGPSLGAIRSLHVSIGSVELTPSIAHTVGNSAVFLRYVVPACCTSPSGSLSARDVVTACCREVQNYGATFVFNHASEHSLQLTAESLPKLTAQPLQLELLIESKDSQQLVALAAAEAPWHQAMLRGGRHRDDVELLSAQGPFHELVVAGRVSITVSLTEGESSWLRSGPAAGFLEPRGVHLKVWLRELRLLAPSLRGVFVVLKLGPEQEVVAHLAKDEQQADGPALVGQLKVPAIAERPAWSVDVARQVMVAGPEPEKLFFQVWRGEDLLGLAAISVPSLSEEALEELCGGEGRPSVVVGADEMPVKSTVTGEVIGSLSVGLCAEAIFNAEKILADKRSAGSYRMQEINADAAEEDAVALSRLPPARACLELIAPISEQEVATWFGAVFIEHLAEALQISPSRLRILRVDPDANIAFEIAAGPPMEATPDAALQELHRQLVLPSSRLRSGSLGEFLERPTLDDALIASYGGSSPSRPPPVRKMKSPRQASPRSPRLATSVARDLQERIFEVILASGVEPSVAFSVLDWDKDGTVALTDMFALLRQLGIPFSQEAEIAAIHGDARGLRVDLTQFVEQFMIWLRQRLPPSPRAPKVQSPRLAEPRDPWESVLIPAGRAGARCLLLPSFLLYAFLDPDGHGKVSPECWRCFAYKCLGLGPEATARAFALCDQHKLGFITYRDFRRYTTRVDQLNVQRQSPQAAAELEEFRGDVRAVLELADPPNSSGFEVPSRAAKVAEALEQRGRSLSSQVSVSGLVELLSDLRLPLEVAAPLLEWQEAVSVAIGPLRDTESPPSSYRTLMESLSRARGLLQGHLDALLGACLVASADLKEALEFAVRRPSQALSVEELVGCLRAADVDLKAVELRDLLLVLDPHGCHQIFAPDLIEAYAKFQSRYSSLLTKMASNLGRTGRSPDELRGSWPIACR